MLSWKIIAINHTASYMGVLEAKNLRVIVRLMLQCDGIRTAVLIVLISALTQRYYVIRIYSAKGRLRSGFVCVIGRCLAASLSQ